MTNVGHDDFIFYFDFVASEGRRNLWWPVSSVKDDRIDSVRLDDVTNTMIARFLRKVKPRLSREAGFENPD